MEEVDEVGEVDFPFDLSEWMVVDDDDEGGDESPETNTEKIEEELQKKYSPEAKKAAGVTGVSKNSLSQPGDKNATSTGLPQKDPGPASKSKASTPSKVSTKAPPAKKVASEPSSAGPKQNTAGKPSISKPLQPKKTPVTSGKGKTAQPSQQVKSNAAVGISKVTESVKAPSGGKGSPGVGTPQKALPAQKKSGVSAEVRNQAKGENKGPVKPVVKSLPAASSKTPEADRSNDTTDKIPAKVQNSESRMSTNVPSSSNETPKKSLAQTKQTVTNDKAKKSLTLTSSATSGQPSQSMAPSANLKKAKSSTNKSNPEVPKDKSQSPGKSSGSTPDHRQTVPKSSASGPKKAPGNAPVTAAPSATSTTASSALSAASAKSPHSTIKVGLSGRNAGKYLHKGTDSLTAINESAPGQLSKTVSKSNTSAKAPLKTAAPSTPSGRGRIDSAENDPSSSLADLMTSVEEYEDRGGGAFDLDVEDVSDTELPVIPSSTVGKTEKPGKTLKSKRASSAEKDGPQPKKLKTSSSAGSAVTLDSSKVSLAKNMPDGNAVVKTASNIPLVKGQSDVTPRKETSNAVRGNPTETNAKNLPVASKASGPKVMGAKTGKRIIRRFHRTTQTVSKTSKNKMLQCLIRIPSLDARAVQTRTTGSQVIAVESQSVWETELLPDYSFTLDVFKAVGTFDVTKQTSRLSFASFKHGISFGPVLSADLDKSSFRDEILKKADSYSVSFIEKDAGVVDLFFYDMETFVNMTTQLRRTRIGSRYLVVTFCAQEEKKNSTSDGLGKMNKATVVFDQNFSSTTFLSYMKAAVWNKPKVEENLSMYNIPEGISTEFVKTVMPDAITVELDVGNPDKSRLNVGLSRKTGCDQMRHLFSQVYLDDQKVLMLSGMTHSGETPELKELLAKKKKQSGSVEAEKEIVGRTRDIFSTEAPIPQTGERIDIILHVDDESNVSKILAGQANTWKGPSVATQVRQILQVQANELASAALSDVSEDLSDISETSDIGDSPSPLKRKTATFRKSSLPEAYRPRPSERLEDSPHRSRTSVSKSVASTEDRRRDRYLTDQRDSHSQRSSNYSKQLHKKEESFRVERRYDGYDWGQNERKGGSRDGSQRDFYASEGKRGGDSRDAYSRYDATNEERRTTQARDERRGDVGPDRDRYEIAKDYGRREREEPKRAAESSRDILRRERIEIERMEKEKNATRGGQKSQSGSEDRSQEARERSKQEAKQEEEDRLARAIKATLGYSVQEEKKWGGSQGDRQRERSPLGRRTVARGRSTSPSRARRPAESSGTSRRLSRSPGTTREQRHRKSLSPRPRRRSQSPYKKGRSALSPISIGDDDDNVDLRRGMWLSQPPSAMSGSWKQDSSKGTTHPKSSLKSNPTESEKLLQRLQESRSSKHLQPEDKAMLTALVKHMVSRAQKPSQSSQAAGDKTPTAQFIPGFHDPARFAKKLRDQLSSGDTAGALGRSSGRKGVTKEDLEPKTTGVVGGAGSLYGSSSLGDSFRSGKSIPPPIPPPIAPPLLSSSSSAQPAEKEAERVSCLETLANQLAVEILQHMSQPSSVVPATSTGPPPIMAGAAAMHRLAATVSTASAPPPHASSAPPPMLTGAPPPSMSGPPPTLSGPPPPIAGPPPPFGMPPAMAPGMHMHFMPDPMMALPPDLSQPPPPMWQHPPPGFPF
ncbi:uncharacterized protein LOC101863216 [Aplysia californica]|uniref:Uncharacterized protein LOC101863216 n=1 Tax=Aplysia californica TaxID=6500 RepID=A0ABM0K4G0_APLCA|nr:uncharacterized protein LOC101863216 [Aplysia californica]XP_005108518.1 uncharacterized protein LOC101863216 [Aplysia californica]XP_005108519.1 uncharacterized protein LOC101863216 [Aplysia californica]XP_005108520.1 uncharacterized protein LOC101863216 [Aplysia californica]XP_035828324.1 uncharacterized protein LOC101863216 [Aplysia californica]